MPPLHSLVLVVFLATLCLSDAFLARPTETPVDANQTNQTRPSAGVNETDSELLARLRALRTPPAGVNEAELLARLSALPAPPRHPPLQCPGMLSDAECDSEEGYQHPADVAEEATGLSDLEEWPAIFHGCAGTGIKCGHTNKDGEEYGKPGKGECPEGMKCYSFKSIQDVFHNFPNALTFTKLRCDDVGLQAALEVLEKPDKDKDKEKTIKENIKDEEKQKKMGEKIKEKLLRNCHCCKHQPPVSRTKKQITIASGSDKSTVHRDTAPKRWRLTVR
ncbi:unnamed protein product [Vitrella brassicaformis CCMP3155]|uniref:Uncharacterized protein n=1 Tax=Vitrella brassicaformis (strain CCMP3155) TaxID=1169540 RepID=A0A0G4G1S9_VITBC|nr:unnamed protein product [Vitrella brassicaformis CCMP3155]|eukprot:CEM22012.1 unnamed protein product [Vitrella brassicaformis CCMP3155]